MAKYFDFKVSAVKNEIVSINGVSFIPGDKSIDIIGMEEIFTGRNIDAKELRKKAWQRSK